MERKQLRQVGDSQSHDRIRRSFPPALPLFAFDSEERATVRSRSWKLRFDRRNRPQTDLEMPDEEQSVASSDDYDDLLGIRSSEENGLGYWGLEEGLEGEKETCGGVSQWTSRGSVGWRS